LRVGIVGVDDRNPKQRSQRPVLQHRRRGRVDSVEMDVFIFPVSWGMKSGKYMHKVRADMVRVK